MKLKSPGHVFVGGKLYEQDKDGTVDVPEEHAAGLIESHGCKTPEDAEAEEAARAAHDAAPVVRISEGKRKRE